MLIIMNLLTFSSCFTLQVRAVGVAVWRTVGRTVEEQNASENTVASLCEEVLVGLLSAAVGALIFWLRYFATFWPFTATSASVAGKGRGRREGVRPLAPIKPLASPLLMTVKIYAMDA